MIPEAELRGLARRRNVDLMLLDLDYSLGCFLAGLGRQDLAGRLRFKGGTCLRKCYFPDYRFSEDLDFTAESRLTEANLKAIIEKAMRWVEREIGLDFSVDCRQPDSYLLSGRDSGRENQSDCRAAPLRYLPRRVRHSSIAQAWS